MHALIENYVKNKSVYTQKHWIRLIKECKKEKPYDVQEPSQNDFYSFDALSDLFLWKSAKISTIREIHFSPGILEINVKSNFFEDSKQIKISKKNTKLQDIKTHQLTKAYTSLMPLNENKKKDLNLMISKNLIPNEHISDFSEVLTI